jgi:hypothetical protein
LFFLQFIADFTDFATKILVEISSFRPEVASRGDESDRYDSANLARYTSETSRDVRE